MSWCRFVFLDSVFLSLFMFHLVLCVSLPSTLSVSLPLSLCLSPSVSVSGPVSMCVSLLVSRFSLCLSQCLCPCLCFLFLVPPHVLLHLVRTASFLRPPARGQHRPTPALRFPCWAELGSGLQAPSATPRVLVPLPYLPNLLASLLLSPLTLPLCLSQAAPAPPQPHLPLHIPWAASGELVRPPSSSG